MGRGDLAPSATLLDDARHGAASRTASPARGDSTVVWTYRPWRAWVGVTVSPRTLAAVLLPPVTSPACRASPASDADRRLDARAEETLPDAHEAVGRIGDEEARRARPAPARRAGRLQLGDDLAGRLLRRIDQRDRGAHDLGDERLQQRIVGAAQDERVDAAAREARQAGRGDAA